MLRFALPLALVSVIFVTTAEAQPDGDRLVRRVEPPIYVHPMLNQDGRQQQPGDMPLVPIPREACPSLDKLGYRFKRITDIELSLALDDEFQPEDCATALFLLRPIPGTVTEPVETIFTWAPSEIYHRPLYWDDPLLERYGQTFKPLPQAGLSGAHFFGNFVMFPYKAIADPIFSHVYNLGYYRPGSHMHTMGRWYPPLR